MDWFADPPDEHHAASADALLEIWMQFPDTAVALANLEWVTDGITEAEAGAMVHIHHMTSYDPGFVAQVLSFIWVSDGVSSREAGYLSSIAATVQENEAAKHILRYEWVQDGVVRSEHNGMEILLRVANLDPSLAQNVVNLTWIEDGMTEIELATLRALADIADNNQPLALKVAGYRWMQHGIDIDHQYALESLSSIAQHNLDIAEQLGDAIWLRDVDDVTSFESDVLYSIYFITKADRQIWDRLPNLVAEPIGRFEHAYLEGLAYLRLEHIDAFKRLVQQVWFTDGLSREELAFIATIRDIISNSPEDFEEMIVQMYTGSKSVVLPQSGNVEIFAVQKAPFPDGENATDLIEAALFALEELTQTPLYTQQIVVLIVVVEPDSNYILRSDAPWPGGGFTESHIRVPRNPETNEIEMGTLFHELAHYQFNMFPGWLMEGGASFAQRYIEARNIEQSFEAWVREVDPNISPGCANGATNLHELGVGGIGFQKLDHGGCFYEMGEHFFASLFHTFGQDAVSKGLRDILAIPTIQQDRRVTSKDIFLAFGNHIPADHEPRYLEVFSVLHGGPLVADWSSVEDPEADTPEGAVRIETDSQSQASLDHPFDIDYFTVSLEDGQTVLPQFESYIELDPLGEDLRVTWLLPDGVEPDGISSVSGDAASMQVEWIAPVAGDYAFKIESTSGHTGEYSVNITSAYATPDQHGDTPDQSTEITPNQPLTGAMNDPTDRDVFRLQTLTNRAYKVVIVNSSLRHTFLNVFEQDGRTATPPIEWEWGFDGAYFSWVPSVPGTYYIEVSSDLGNIGAYSITITESVLGADDHGDDHSTATLLQVDETVGASLSHARDSDYFRFHAEKDRAYNILIDDITMPRQILTVFDVNGLTPIHRDFPTGVYETSGSMTPFIAPDTGEYFISYESVDGDTGDYAVNVIPSGYVQDEHGDTTNTATQINLNETLEGSLNERYDFDYFKVDVEAGENYFIALDYPGARNRDDIPAPRIDLRAGDSLQKVVSDVEYGLKTNGKYLNWKSSANQTCYVIVWSSNGYDGSYSLIVETGATTANTP